MPRGTASAGWPMELMELMELMAGRLASKPSDRRCSAGGRRLPMIRIQLPVFARADWHHWPQVFAMGDWHPQPQRVGKDGSHRRRHPRRAGMAECRPLMIRIRPRAFVKKCEAAQVPEFSRESTS